MPAEDQPVARARGGDVDQPAALLGLGLALLRCRGRRAPRAERPRRAGRRAACRSARGAVVGRGEPISMSPRLVAGVEVAAEVGHGDDGELEALGGVHGHHPDPVVALGLHRRHALALVAAGALGGEGEEAGEIAALVALVLARQAHQLAHVRHPPGAALAGDQAEVVAEGAHRPLDQLLERQQRRLGAQAGEDRAEALEPRGVLGRDRVEPLGLAASAARAPSP